MERVEMAAKKVAVRRERRKGGWKNDPFLKAYFKNLIFLMPRPGRSPAPPKTPRLVDCPAF
jgi:hypothetical protein